MKFTHRGLRYHVVKVEVRIGDIKQVHNGKGKGHPATGPGGQSGSGQVKAPDFLDVWHYEGCRSSALRTGRLYPRRNPWHSFSEAESTPGHTVPSGGATEKNPP